MKHLLTSALLLGTTTLWAQNNNYTIEGKLPSIKAPAKTYLQYRENGKIIMDSTVVQDGKFSFRGTISNPSLAYLLIDKTGAGFSNRRPISSAAIYLEPGTIMVSSPDSLENAVRSGTPLNKDYQDLVTMLKPGTGKMSKLMDEYRSATSEQRKSKAFEDDMNTRYEAIEKDQKVARTQFIKTHPNSMVSMNTLQQFSSMPEYAEVGPLYDGLSETIKSSKAGQEYAKLLASMKATAIGAMAPEFMQADTSGKDVALNSFRGKYVLVDFWASWCGPCRQENPNVVKNFQQFKDKNFTVLGVSLDRPGAKDAWLNAIHKDGLAWTQVSDLKFWDNDVAKLYGVRAIPQNFLIDPSGKIVAKNIRGEELSKKLTALLPAKP